MKGRGHSFLHNDICQLRTVTELKSPVYGRDDFFLSSDPIVGMQTGERMEQSEVWSEEFSSRVKTSETHDYV